MATGSVHIVTELSSVLNHENVRNDINLRELERSLLDETTGPRPADLQTKYTEDLSRAARALGIDIPDRDSSSRSSRSSSRSVSPRTSYDEPRGRSPPSYASSEHRTDREPPRYEDNRTQWGARRDYRSPEESPDVSPAREYSYSPERTTDTHHSRRYKTQEQTRRAHIDSVVGYSAGSSQIFEREKRDEEKCNMLAEIDDLIVMLTDEECDLRRIPVVDCRSSFDGVADVLRILRRKADHIRCRSFAEEFLLFGAHTCEDLFDGKRVWFGRYQPDLTGWHNQVNVKIKRMRRDTSNVVSNIMQDYDIGAGARILLELLPNMVLYSKHRKEQYNQPNFLDAAMDESVDALS